MYTGKTLFAQLMDFLPWTTFARIVERYSGDRYVKSLRCTEHFRVIAFAQLRNAVAIQQRVGIRAITHGELRRNNWRDRFFERVNGFSQERIRSSFIFTEYSGEQRRGMPVPIGRRQTTAAPIHHGR
jgi:hypothetical protein